MTRDLTRVERALIEADRSDLEEERVAAVGAVAAVLLVAVILLTPALAFWLMRGSKILLFPAAAGTLGAASVLRSIRRMRAARRLASEPIPPPRPTTQMMWLSTEPGQGPTDSTAP